MRRRLLCALNNVTNELNNDNLPLGFKRVEYLESTGTQYIDTGVILPTELTAEWKAQVLAWPEEAQFVFWGATQTQGSTVISREFAGLSTLSKEYSYLIWGVNEWLDTFHRPFSGEQVMLYLLRKTKGKDTELIIDGSKIITSHSGQRETGVEIYPCAVFGRIFNGQIQNFINARLWFLKVTSGEKPLVDYIPALDPTGVPCMFDLVTRKPFRNNGVGQFIAGLTITQAINLANLPVTAGGTLTVSLPLEAAFDDNVKRALKAAAAKGWHIPVQYRESDLTTKNIEADFLKSTGAQYINTGVEVQSGLAFECEFLDLNKPDEQGGARYVFGGFGNRFAWSWGFFNPPDSYVVAWTCTGEYNGAWRNYTPIDELKANKHSLIVEEGNAILDGVAYFEKVNLNNIYDTPSSIGLYGHLRDYAPVQINKFKIWSFNILKNNIPVLKFVPRIDSAGVPCMYDTVSDQNFYNADTSEEAIPFIIGFDTTEKAAVSLSKLPITTNGTLTVSLPAEAKNEDTWVPEACRIAAKRGWIIFPQYRED